MVRADLFLVVLCLLRARGMGPRPLMLVMRAQALLPIISGLVYRTTPIPCFSFHCILYNYRHQFNSFFKVVVWVCRKTMPHDHQRRDSRGYKAATIIGNLICVAPLLLPVYRNGPGPAEQYYCLSGTWHRCFCSTSGTSGQYSENQ